jgi:hypothetical protein
VPRKARFWERLAGAKLHPRRHAMLQRRLDGFVGKLTTSKAAALTKGSQDGAPYLSRQGARTARLADGQPE